LTVALTAMNNTTAEQMDQKQRNASFPPPHTHTHTHTHTHLTGPQGSR